MRFDAVVCREGFARKFSRAVQVAAATAMVLVRATAWTEGVAHATVTLPNGLVVPIDSTQPPTSNNETQLYTLFASRNEQIDYKADAHATPDSFSPLCDFSASLVLKQSQSSIAVGWYNVVPGATTPPAQADIYQIIPAGVQPPYTVTGASIRLDPHYIGGLVGFALKRTPPSFTESKWNTKCTLGACASTPGPWILSVSYQSKVTPNAYYLAFEDGDTSSSSWNNDGDYNDYVFFFTGLACAGAGAACTVPNKVGACAQGFMECDGAGNLVCKQVTQPSAEKCDGLDNDCNDVIDDGDNLCDADKVCSKGKCERRCGGGEFTCAFGTVCSNDLCIDPACVDVTCPAGNVCVGGTCKAACDGVVCPSGQLCRVGRCTDPCAGVTCGSGKVCESGVCVASCACQACANSALTCSATSGHCVESACATVTCSAGTVCSAGQCKPVCDGVVCPAGQACDSGNCIDVVSTEVPDAGGGFDPGSGDPVADGGPTAGGGADGGATTAGADPGFGTDKASSGCGCRVTGTNADASPLFVALAGVATALARRTVRRKKK